MALTAAQITTAFQNVLQRSPSTAELNSYVAVSSSGALSDAQVYSAIVNSAEAGQYVNPVVRFYQAAFGRVPDKAGLTQQVTTLEVPGQSLKTIATGFTQSQEFINRYGSGTTVDTAYLQALYVNVLGRTGTAAEIQNWLTTVATPGSGYTTRADVLFGFAQSVEFQNDANVGTTTFLTQAAQGTATYTGALAVNYSQSTTSLVLTTGLDNILGTTGADTINATLITPAGGATNTSTLTAGDTINGNGGTDTLRLIADSSNGAITGIPAGVSISGVTNLNLQATGGGAITLDTSLVGGLTNISVTDAGTGALALNNINKAVSVNLLGQQTTGGTTLQYATVGSSDTVNIATNGTYGATTTTNAAVALTAATGNAPANVALTGTGGLLTLTDASLKTVTINETGVTKLTLNNSTTLTSVDGSASTGALTVDVSGTTVSATGSFKGGQGNDTFRFGAGQLTGTTQTLDGGAGTDILGIGDGTISAGTAALNSAINNAKNFEVLGFTNTAGVTVDVSKVATFNTFDILNAQAGNGIAGTSSANNAGGNGAAATAVDVFTGESNGQTFIFDAGVSSNGGAGGAGQNSNNVGGTGGAGNTAVSFAPALDNGANSINLTFNGVTISANGGAGGAGVGTANNSTGGAGGTAIAAGTFETVNIVSNNSADGTVTANVLSANGGAAGTGGTGNAGTAGAAGSGLTVATAATINVSGAADFNAGQISGTNITVNASTFTGKLTLGTGTGNDTITGGTNVNTLTLTGGADTVDITRSTSKSDVLNVTSGTNTDAQNGQFTSVTGFSDTATNNDRLDFLGATTVAVHNDTGTSTNTGVTNLSATSTGGIVTFSGSAAATATLAQKVTAAFSAAVLNGDANTAVAFVDNGSTYVAVETGGAAGYNAGTDIVVKLVGVTDATALSATAGATKIVIA